MANPTPPLEPRPARQYFIPRDASRLSILSAAGALLVLVVGFGLYAVGWTRLGSPGPLVSAHASLDGSCSQCHQAGHGATDLRCERCHDPLDARRFASAAHVLAGTGDAWKADHATTVACAVCHTEHRGRTVVLRTPDDRQCVVCHQFGSFRSHPEMAILRAGGTTAVGLNFSHAKHLSVLAKTAAGVRCESCHERTTDERGFQALNFDRACASCHVMGGSLTNGVDPLSSTWPADAVSQRPAAVGHRDMRVLAEAARLGAVFDPGDPATVEARRRLRDSMAVIAGQEFRVVAGLQRTELDAWASAVRQDLEAIDRQLATPAGQLSGASKEALESLLSGVKGADPTLATALAGIGEMTAAPASSPGGPGTEPLGQRKSELAALLAAIANRGTATEQRAAKDLEQRLSALTPDHPGPAPDRSVALDRLRALEGQVITIGPSAPAAATDLRRTIAAMRAQALGLAAGGLGTYQNQILSLLDQIEPRAGVVERRQIADIRAAVAGLERTGVDARALTDRRIDKLRLLERIQLQAELSSGADGRGPADAVLSREQAQRQDRVKTLKAQLAALDTVPPSPSPHLTPRAAKQELTDLLNSCLFCHHLNAAQSRLAPVRSSLSMLTAASFSHKPHVAQATCESCHSGVATSGDRMEGVQDSLLPGISSCRTCHTPGQSRTDCASCHSYHAANATSIEGLHR